MLSAFPSGPSCHCGTLRPPPSEVMPLSGCPRRDPGWRRPEASASTCLYRSAQQPVRCLYAAYRFSVLRNAAERTLCGVEGCLGCDRLTSGCGVTNAFSCGCGYRWYLCCRVTIDVSSPNLNLRCCVPISLRSVASLRLHPASARSLFRLSGAPECYFLVHHTSLTQSPLAMLPTLIVGAGIAGLPAAIQLAKAGKPSIVVERCPGLETKGQNIDLRGPGQEVMIRMGLDKAVRSKSTKETGTSFEDENKRQWAFFGAAPEGEKRFSPTSDVEILRGDLADIFYQEALKFPDLISFRFGAKIATIQEDAQSVTLKLVDGESLRGNILIGADGQGSQIRSLCLASTSKITVHSFDMYTAYYTLPRLPQDTNVWRIHNATRGRSLFLRPDGSETTVRGCLNVHGQRDPKTIEAFAQRDSELHKQTLKSLFADVEWEGPRLIAALDSTEDFYLQPIVQVRMDKWHHGRVVVLGDAAWAPSPMTGMGTT